MTKEDINAFSKRIAQSNKTQLVVVTYEIIINYLESSLAALEQENEDEFVDDLQRAKRFIDDLAVSLKFENEIAYDLMSLYSFADRCIMKSIVKKDSYHIGVVRDVMKKLGESFEKISEEDDSEAVMKNSMPIYAGITYGKNSVNEITEPGVTYN